MMLRLRRNHRRNLPKGKSPFQKKEEKIIRDPGHKGMRRPLPNKSLHDAHFAVERPTRRNNRRKRTINHKPK